MGDIGLKVSVEDVDVFEAEGADILLNSDPQAKLDTTNSKSFENITLTFINNPPEPPGLTGFLDTLVYSYPHGYTYIPEAWFLVQVVVPSSTATGYQEYFQDTGIIARRTAFDEADFYIVCDATTVYMYVSKYTESGFGGLTNDLTGMQLRIRSYIFVDDIGL